MRDIPLRYDSKEHAVADLVEHGWQQDENGKLFKPRHHIVMLGTLYHETGNMLTDENGFEYPETEALPGYHVDILCPDADAGCYTPIVVNTRSHRWS